MAGKIAPPLEPFSFAQQPNTDDGQQDGNGDDTGKPPLAVLKRIGDVHSIERGDHRRDHQYDGYRGELLHDVVHVVGDDRSIGIHHAGKDAGVDVGQFLRLTELDLGVFQQVLIEEIPFVFQVLESLEQDQVAIDGGDEEYE